MQSCEMRVFPVNHCHGYLEEEQVKPFESPLYIKIAGNLFVSQYMNYRDGLNRFHNILAWKIIY